MIQCDVLVVGAGIAGASVASLLAANANVIMIERENAPGYHSTGRSAALYTETYGNETIRALTVASRPYFTDVTGPNGEPAMLSPRGTMVIARADQQVVFEAAHKTATALSEGVQLLPRDEIIGTVPVLRPENIVHGFLEVAAMDMDVDAIHQAYLGTFRGHGGTLVTDAEVLSLRRTGNDWLIETSVGDYMAAVVVNAAGAWADDLGGRSGINQVGLTPKRRTAFTFAAPDGIESAFWPAVIDVDEQFYFKPDAGLILASPADETPQPPNDAQPEEIDIAVAVERLQTATSLEIKRLNSKWAGLRTFAPDKTPVVGFDPEQDGFFWLAGQGGYGIMTSPAMALIAAGLIEGPGIPEEITARGITAATLSPGRFS